MHEIQNTSEFETLVNSEKYVLVDFSAEWCGPCKRLKPQLEELSQHYSNCKFVKIDVDAHSELAESHKVEAMPTIMFYVDGVLQKEFVRGADIDKIKTICHKFFV
jgi:thioredoxin